MIYQMVGAELLIRSKKFNLEGLITQRIMGIKSLLKMAWIRKNGGKWVMSGRTNL